MRKDSNTLINVSNRSSAESLSIDWNAKNERGEEMGWSGLRRVMDLPPEGHLLYLSLLSSPVWLSQFTLFSHLLWSTRDNGELRDDRLRHPSALLQWSSHFTRCLRNQTERESTWNEESGRVKTCSLLPTLFAHSYHRRQSVEWTLCPFPLLIDGHNNALREKKHCANFFLLLSDESSMKLKQPVILTLLHLRSHRSVRRAMIRN